MATAIATIPILTGERWLSVLKERLRRPTKEACTAPKPRRKNWLNATDEAWKWFARCWKNQNWAYDEFLTGELLTIRS